MGNVSVMFIRNQLQLPWLLCHDQVYCDKRGDTHSSPAIVMGFPIQCSLFEKMSLVAGTEKLLLPVEEKPKTRTKMAAENSAISLLSHN